MDKSTMYQRRLELNERMLQEQKDFDGWDENMRELQEKNVKANIIYFKNRIRNLKRTIARQEERTNG
jgi:hypothetical protein